MTWVKFIRDHRYSDTRVTRYFKAGDHENLPRTMADSCERSGAGVKEVKKREKSGTDETNLPTED